MSVGTSIRRVDALDKVIGRARYTDDCTPERTLVAKVLHSTIANGLVKSMQTEKAEALRGVVKVVTCFDVPDIPFPTAGHPWSTDEKHQDVADRKLLNTRVRHYGDDIAVVIAKDEFTAKQALKLIDVEYEEYPPLLSVEEAMAEGAVLMHENCPNNILAKASYAVGDYEEALKEPNLRRFEGEYTTPIVQHCHIENPTCFAYMEGEKVVVVTSTQIPHIIRRVVGQALNIPWGNVRVIKPYIGGGFGNKQDALYEPLCAYLTNILEGKCVKLELTREETFFGTRVRHAIKFKIVSHVRPDGTFAARSITAYSNQGAYASHGHAIAMNAINQFRQLYMGVCKGEAYTVYTSMPTAGAMRAYGIPQAIFAIESHIDDISIGMGMDPTLVRKKNMMQDGYVDPISGIACHSYGLEECLERGKSFTEWREKRHNNHEQSGLVRQGIGMSIFCYKTGVYPISLETASCRMTLNQDASIQLQMGATEIGQGADTVFTQMASYCLDIPVEQVHIVSTQDTDICPFDTGAYASRQSYVGGMALKLTADKLKERIIEFGAKLLGRDSAGIELKRGFLMEEGTTRRLISLKDIAMRSYYDLEETRRLTAEETYHCKDNSFSFGACFAEIEVDIPLCQIKILNIINLHDCGRLLNPQLAGAQVHGGMSMGMGYGLYEQLLFDKKGRMLNGNLLDYKLMTALDTPDLMVNFVETYDKTGPFGNKSLGEPPSVPVASAIRNALYNATGVAFNTIPITPQVLFERFKKEGLL